MGYTNYWHQHNDFTNNQWKEIKEEYEYIKEIVGFLIQDESTNDIIKFNGIGDNEHEDFYLSKFARPYGSERYQGDDISFGFCKTARKPYDLAVWYMLTFINRINPSISISRDR